jgi:hypothetical protein
MTGSSIGKAPRKHTLRGALFFAFKSCPLEVATRGLHGHAQSLSSRVNRSWRGDRRKGTLSVIRSWMRLPTRTGPASKGVKALRLRRSTARIRATLAKRDATPARSWVAVHPRWWSVSLAAGYPVADTAARTTLRPADSPRPPVGRAMVVNQRRQGQPSVKRWRGRERQ